MTYSSSDLKLRILISGHLPPPMGGIAAYYQALLNSSLPERVNLQFVRTSSQKRTLSQSGNFNFSNLISAITDIARFTKAVIKHRPQLTHIATAHGLSFLKHSICVIIARLLGSRVLIHPHCSISPMYTNCSRAWQWFFRWVIRMTNGVIILSNEWNLLATIVPGIPVYYLPNAIDQTVFHGIAVERQTRTKFPSQLKVLYLGCLGKTKGSFDLVNAAKKAVSTKNLRVFFELVGEELLPGDFSQLNMQINQAGLQDIISIRPPVTGSEKINLFREADIFAYPSYSEGMPMAVIEAMACGLPIIATRVGGLPDLVCDGINGILVDAGSIDQLTMAIQNLSLNSDLRFSMQVNSYQIAIEKFEIERLVLQLVGIYKKALAIV